MCSEYHVKVSIEAIANELDQPIKSKVSHQAWDKRIKFTNKAPVLLSNGQDLTVDELIFPANPFPNSRLSQIQSNKSKTTASLTDEEQIVRIYEVPLWKEGFTKHPCLIPMSRFYEPAYWGDHAGDIIEFQDQNAELMFVPGFLVKPRVPATGQYNGFTLLTHTAGSQMLQYHHRQIVQLKPEDAVKYLQLDHKDPMQKFNFILEHRLKPEFKIRKERSMAKGWEKRVDQHLAKLEEEKAYRKTLKKEEVPG